MNPCNQEATEHERSTTEVLVAYRMSAFGYNDMPDDAPHDPEELAEVDAEFYNWLNEVRAEAWEKGHEAAAMRVPEGVWHDTASPRTPNPYRKEPEA